MSLGWTELSHKRRWLYLARTRVCDFFYCGLFWLGAGGQYAQAEYVACSDGIRVADLGIQRQYMSGYFRRIVTKHATHDAGKSVSVFYSVFVI